MELDENVQSKEYPILDAEVWEIRRSMLSLLESVIHFHPTNAKCFSWVSVTPSIPAPCNESTTSAAKLVQQIHSYGGKNAES